MQPVHLPLFPTTFRRLLAIDHLHCLLIEGLYLIILSKCLTEIPAASYNIKPEGMIYVISYVWVSHPFSGDIPRFLDHFLRVKEKPVHVKYQCPDLWLHRLSSFLLYSFPLPMASFT